MNRLFTLAAGAALTLALGCGGNSPSPTAPGQTGSAEATGINAIVSIRIDGPTALTVGESARLKVVARLAGGVETDVTARAAFTVNNPGIATVSESGELKALAAGDCGLSAVVGALSSNLNLTVRAKLDVIARLSVRGKADLEVGEKTQLQAIATLDTGAEVDVTARAKFSSSNEAILKVSASGELEAIGPGDCDILSIVDDVRASVRVKVRARVGGPGDEGDRISRIDIRGKVSLQVGERTQLKAIAVLQSGLELDVTAKVTFSSSNEAILKISSGGVLEAVGAGDCDIISVHEGVRAVVRATVNARPSPPAGEDRIQRLEIRGKVALDVGESTTLKVIAVLQSGAETDVTGRAVLEASNHAILRVGADAKLEGVGIGDCDLLAIVDGIRAAVKVNVRLGAVARLEILGASSDLEIGAKVNVNVMAVNVHGVRIDVTGDTQLSTSNQAVLKVGAGGLLEAVGAGSCDLVAIKGDVRALLRLNVKAKAVTVVRLRIDGAAGLVVGQTALLKVIATMSDNSELDVSEKVAWSTSNGVCGLSFGILSALLPGECLVTAILDGVRATANVIVTAAPTQPGPLNIVRIRIEGPSLLRVGHTAQLKVIATMSDGSEQDVTARASWTSNNILSLLVNLTGVLQALLPGDCLITGAVDGIKATLAVKVTL